MVGTVATSPGRPAGATGDIPGSVSRDQLDALRLAAADKGAPQVAVTGPDPSSLRIVWANDAVLELLGCEPDEVIGRLLGATAAQPQDGPPDWSVVAATAVGEPAEWLPAVVRRPDLVVVPVQVLVSAVPADGWLVQLRATTDVEQAAEDRHRESEHRFRALADHAPVGIVLSEAGVRLGFVNDRFAEIAGVDRAGLLGNRWLDVIFPEDQPLLHEALQEVLSGASVERTVRMLALAEHPRWVQFRLAPVTTTKRAAGFIGTVEDITTRRAWEAQLAHQASHDSLTGLANRRQLIETLTELLSSRRAQDRNVAVLFCDLDRFKQVNDTLGHDAGDRVLIEVGRRLSATARDHDLVARIAGDEFVVVLREIRDEAEAEAAAARQVSALSPPIQVAGQALQVSASIGVVLATAQDTPASLLLAADRGMYQAKTAGRATYRLIRPGSTPGVEET